MSQSNKVNCPYNPDPSPYEGVEGLTIDRYIITTCNIETVINDYELL